jgi:putative spermidine/putrescine transport system ATP-binding protein
MLSLRPERIEINPDDGSVPNVLQGRIEELIYLGDHIRTRMSVAGHDDFVVKVPNRAGHKFLEEGQTASVGWRTADCRALDPVTA